METPYHDLIEEYQSEDIISVNHSKLIHRLCVALDQYDELYDTLPELELELSAGKCKPDVSIYPKLATDWFNDIIFYNQPPIIAIEVLSPKQGLSDLIDKAFKIYFPAGVKAVWLIVPMMHIVQILLPDGTQLTWSSGLMEDPILKLTIDIDRLFR